LQNKKSAEGSSIGKTDRGYLVGAVGEFEIAGGIALGVEGAGLGFVGVARAAGCAFDLLLICGRCGVKDDADVGAVPAQDLEGAVLLDAAEPRSAGSDIEMGCPSKMGSIWVSVGAARVPGGDHPGLFQLVSLLFAT
jgi:hypothetical protein